MDPDRKPVELVQVPKEERYYDREEVLGRDAASVFPTESKKAAGAAGAALAEMLGGGNKRFISETELEEIKSQRGLSVEDGTFAADKPLVEVLREAKEAKELAFQQQWKTMKQGKNRPLDDDEFDFLDTVAEREAAALRAARQEEEDALAAFHAAQQQREGGGAEAGPQMGPQLGPEQAPGAGAGPVRAAAQEAAPARRQPPKKQPLVAIKPLARPVVRVKNAAGTGAAAADAGGGPASKRQRTAYGAWGQTSGSGSEEGPGLAGLLGGYGSDDSGSS